MEEQFFYLEPEQNLVEFITECKNTALSIAGNQKYLDDKAHLTLYVGNFDVEQAMTESLNANLQFKAQEIELNGWTVFYDDPVTAGHTVVIEVAEKSMDKLRKIQWQVVSCSSKFRKHGVLNRYAKNNCYSAEMKQSLDKYGFPFIGKLWRAHFTIASFKPEDFKQVWPVLSQKKVPQKTTLNSLGFSQIRMNEFAAICKWPRKGTH